MISSLKFYIKRGVVCEENVSEKSFSAVGDSDSKFDENRYPVARWFLYVLPLIELCILKLSGHHLYLPFPFNIAAEVARAFDDLSDENTISL